MNQYRARLFLIVALLMAGTAAIIIRLFTIQIMDNQRYATRSRDQTQQRRILSAKGAIFTTARALFWLPAWKVP